MHRSHADGTLLSKHIGFQRKEPSRCAMFIVLLKISAAPGQRRQIVDMLRPVIGPASVKTGCLGCGVYESLGDEQSILYMERWETEADAQPHIRSALFENILAALDLSSTPPVIEFVESLNVWGMELLKLYRDAPDRGV